MNPAVLLFVKFACILGFLGIPGCAAWKPAADPRLELERRIASSPELAVLFVGNSYSFGVPREFAKQAAARGKKVRVGHSVHGGWTLARHAADAGTLRKIRDGKWDIVVFQEYSAIPSRSGRRRAKAMDRPLRELVAEARRAGAVPVLYQTWGRRDGFEEMPGDDFHAMTGRVRAGYRAAARNAGGLHVVPVGDVWEQRFSRDLYVDDGSHPSAAGNRLTAEVFVDAIFGRDELRGPNDKGEREAPL